MYEFSATLLTIVYISGLSVVNLSCRDLSVSLLWTKKLRYLCFKIKVWWLECSPMARETWVQSQVESYQRLKKWYLMLPCLTLSNIKWGSRVKWSNPGKGVASSLTPRCSSYRKGSLRVTLDYGRHLNFTYSSNVRTSAKTQPVTCLNPSDFQKLLTYFGT